MISTVTDSVFVVLLDDGNLVLRYGSNSSLPSWQSFDHPTHAFLPGGKLGYNKLTNTKQVLTSWKNTEDPAVGRFSLEIDQNQKQYKLIWNGSEEYWTSGPWNGRIFSLVPEMRLNYIYNFSYVDNVNESYFTYSLYNPSIISRLIIDISGQIQQQTWLDGTQQWTLFWSQPRQQCEVYASCGAFSTCNQNELPLCNCLTAFEPRAPKDWILGHFSGGCVRKTKLDCRFKQEKSGFISSYIPEETITSFSENEMSVSDESECKTSCLNDCTCGAYTFVLKSCWLWYGETLNRVGLELESGNSTVPFNIKVASSDLPENTAKVNTKKLTAGIISGFGGLVFLCSIGIVFYGRLKRRGSREENQGNAELQVSDVSKSDINWLTILLIIYRRKRRLVFPVESSLVAFVYRDLRTATKNFSDKLGGGGFGSVFKGILPDSTVVAVKKLESVSQGEKQFRTEVCTIGSIQHVHLVRLRGFCSEGNSKLLVYDYIPNGSLDSHLFHEKDDNVLNWKTRYQIALGTARGLVYLHEKCRDCIIHCDIKPENILLDGDFSPKVADFGLAKLVGRDFSRVLTTMRGTRGYLAPEWLSGVAITAKADVYSYGMMLFELVSGRRNSEQSEDGKNEFFPTWTASVLTRGDDILSLLDTKLNSDASVEEVTKICEVACWCVQDEEGSRPSMGEVEHILEGVSDVNMPPIPRFLRLFLDNTEHIVFFTESSSSHSLQVQTNPSNVV